MAARLIPLLALIATVAIGAIEDPGASRETAAGLEAERRMDPKAALAHFRAALEESPGDAFLQQKVAQQLSDLAFIEPDAAARRSLVEEAFVHAERAVELDPASPVAQLSIAVLYGKLAIGSGAGKKVEYGRGIHERATRALELDPNYAWAHHVLGRWHVELSELNFAQRTVVSLFLGGLPKASLSEGIRHLEDAVRLEPDAVAHRVELGFAYRRAGRDADARACWEAALSLPSTRVYDTAAKQRASGALGNESA